MEMDIAAVWHEAGERVKDKYMIPTLWRALENSVAITLEDGQFVVGLGPGSTHLAGHLNAPEYRNAIEAAIAGACGQRVRLVVIDGVGMDEWVNFKARRDAIAEQREKARQKTVRERATTQTWDGVMEAVGRSFAKLQLRQLPQVRAKYIETAVAMISDAMDEIYDEKSPDEASHRALARVIDRVGTLAEVPSTIVALEITRFRKRDSD